MVPLLLKSWKQAVDIWAFLLYNSMLALIGMTAHLNTLFLLPACMASHALKFRVGSNLDHKS